jgi:hypothetical protein
MRQSLPEQCSVPPACLVKAVDLSEMPSQFAFVFPMFSTISVLSLLLEEIFVSDIFGPIAFAAYLYVRPRTTPDLLIVVLIGLASAIRATVTTYGSFTECNWSSVNNLQRSHITTSNYHGGKTNLLEEAVNLGSETCSF